MIDSSLRHKIKGLDELFMCLPENYNFHDDGLVSLNWNMEKEELTVVYSCYHRLDDTASEHLYFVTFHIIPEMNDFEIYMSPHNPYTYGIDITHSDSPLSAYRFEADGSGPIVNCKDLWIEVAEGEPPSTTHEG